MKKQRELKEVWRPELEQLFSVGNKPNEATEELREILKNEISFVGVKNKGGITVRELKEYIASIPEVDKRGEENLVWISHNYRERIICKAIMPLVGGDIILSSIGVS